MQNWIKAYLVTSRNSSSWNPLSSPSYWNERCITCKKVSPHNTAKLFIIIRTWVVFKVYIKTSLSNRMLSRHSYSGTAKQRSHTERVKFYPQNFKTRLRGVVASLWMLQLYRGPNSSAVLRNEEDREDNMQENFCLLRYVYPQNFSVGLK